MRSEFTLSIDMMCLYFQKGNLTQAHFFLTVTAIYLGPVTLFAISLQGCKLRLLKNSNFFDHKLK